MAQGGRLVRLEVTAGAWVLRGGVVGPDVLWRRGADERTERAHGFAGTSPSYDVVLSRLGAGRRRVVAVTEPVLASRVVEQVWTRLAGDGWQVDEPATGTRRVVQVSGDLVLAAPGARLVDLAADPDPDTLVAELVDGDWSP